jgi:hypothetical protein
MKERTIIKSIVGLLIIVGILLTGNTDLIYLACTGLFFALCVAYAVWCERL